MARYIEADLLKYKFIYSTADYPEKDIDNAWIATIRREIINSPTADVAPVVHGRWIKDESGVIFCSECGEEHEWEDYRATYCDTCGAKMDGKKGID